MKTINHQQLKKVILRGYKTRTPKFIWGTMGIGKSSGIKEIAKEIASSMNLEFLEGTTNGEKSFSFIDVRVAQLNPEDLRGLPSIDKEKKTVEWFTPNWLPRDPKSRGILFFDELNLAPPSIQASAYQLILDRRLGDYMLPEGWVIVSAGNTAEDRANIFELPSPLSNRFAHNTLRVPTKDEWVEWALKNDIDYRIISFLEFKPEFLYKFNPKNKDKAFPTPRTWEYASNQIKGENLSLEDLELFVAECVGEGVAMEFVAFNRLQSKIDLKKILADPESVKKITELDLKYSLLSAVVEEYKKDKKNLVKILEICKHMNPEFSILLLRFLNVARPNKQFKNDVIKLEIWKKEIAPKYGKYLINLKGEEDDN